MDGQLKMTKTFGYAEQGGAQVWRIGTLPVNPDNPVTQNHQILIGEHNGGSRTVEGTDLQPEPA